MTYRGKVGKHNYILLVDQNNLIMKQIQEQKQSQTIAYQYHQEEK